MSIENIIVRMPNWVGDLVMATPILADLREKFPDASITAMCRMPICDLLKEDASIDELFCFHKKKNTFLRREDRRDIISKLQAGKFDLGILLTNSFSSAWWFWQGKVKRRLGYEGHFRKFLLTDPVKPHGKMHQVDKYKELLKPLGILPSKTSPRLFVRDEEVKESKELLYQRGYKDGKKLVGISPFAAYGPAKAWPLNRYRKLAEELAKDDVFVVFFGDAIEKDLCQGLSENVINLAGVTSLRELACLIQDCDVFVTNDSGPMHIASALKTPVVALFGSTDDTVTGPCTGDVINKRPSCSPCLRRECPIDFRCMMQISVDEVATLVRKKLGINV